MQIGQPLQTLGRGVAWLMVLTILFILLASAYLQSHDIFTLKGVRNYQEPSKFITYFNGTSLNNGNSSMTMAILLWTGFFYSKRGWLKFYGNFPSSCEHKCKIMTSDKMLNQSDALLFYDNDLSHGNYQFPQRNPNQLWIYHNLEPPCTTLDVGRHNGVFNWTSTIRKDSDVPTSYGKISPLKNTTRITTKDIYSDKSKMVVWMASNCNSHNNRIFKVRELSRYIHVDIYGACGPLKCSRNTASCEKTLKQYKFYLAYENADCRNYVTEKFWRALRRKSIPVVLGSTDKYKNVAPPKSFIAAADFQSNKDLAEYLKKVADDKALFNSYFEWHTSYRIEGSSFWCDLCLSLHTWNGQRQVYHDLQGWYAQDTCSTSNYPDKIRVMLNSWYRTILQKTGLW